MAIAEKALDSLRDGGPGPTPHSVPPAGDEAIGADGLETMYKRLKDGEREDNDDPDVVTRDAVAMVDNVEEHDPDDRATRRRRRRGRQGR